MVFPPVLWLPLDPQHGGGVHHFLTGFKILWYR